MTDYPWLNNYPEQLDWNCVLTPKPMHCLLDETAKKYPDNLALDFMGKEYSYERLADMVDRVAAGLQANGVKRETRVGIFMPNCPQFVIAYYAILKAGGTVVNFNPLYSEREIEHQIHDSKVEVMFTLNLRILYPKLKPFIGTENGLKKVVVGFFQEALPLSKAALYTVAKAKDLYLAPKNEFHVTFNELLSTEPIADENVPETLPFEHMAVIQYTGGTTGVPKGAVLTHANLYINTVQSSLWMDGLEEGKETVLAVIPFFHVFAMTVALNLAIYNGFKIIPHPRFELKSVLNDIQNKKPTLFPGVSTLYATINNYKFLERYDLTSIKKCISGGGPLPVEVKQRFEKLTGCSLVEGYGLTETSPVTHCNPLQGENIEGSIGMPLPGTLPEVISLEDRESVMPVGEAGEICIRGPQVMKGYLNQPEETANVMKNGRLHTGDIGYMDEKGYFYIVDRLKEMIIVGGYNVYPRNVEEVIYAHESVAECAVIGLDHPRRGQMIKAYIVVKEGFSPSDSEIKEFLRERMTRYAVPHDIEFRKELPKSPIGKILKKELVAEEMRKSEEEN
ncbi:MAG: long-chain fatty acid--CoA ligase [Rickettsiales bacterium]|nr:long-chain fatty acid--CoA ligase [Rickettsiales bacterium]